VNVAHDVVGQRKGFARFERAVYEKAWHGIDRRLVPEGGAGG
jgi:hypothetical protein